MSYPFALELFLSPSCTGGYKAPPGYFASQPIFCSGFVLFPEASGFFFFCNYLDSAQRYGFCFFFFLARKRYQLCKLRDFTSPRANIHFVHWCIHSFWSFSIIIEIRSESFVVETNKSKHPNNSFLDNVKRGRRRRFKTRSYRRGIHSEISAKTRCTGGLSLTPLRALLRLCTMEQAFEDESWFIA